MIIITGVAIKSGDSVYRLPKPHRHMDVLALMKRNGIPLVPREEGFILSSGKFVDRFRALVIASETGQLNGVGNGKWLNSTDVW